MNKITSWHIDAVESYLNSPFFEEHGPDLLSLLLEANNRPETVNSIVRERYQYYCNKLTLRRRIRAWAVENFDTAFAIISDKFGKEVAEQLLVYWAYLRFVKNLLDRDLYNAWLKKHNLYHIDKYRGFGIFRGFKTQRRSS